MTGETKNKGRKLNWRQACTILGCGRTKFFDLVNAGQLPAYRTGLRGLWVYESDLLRLVQPVEADAVCNSVKK